MFCPYCGAESLPGLKYCNRCGGSLAPPAEEARPAVRPGTAWAAGTTLTLLVLLGLGLTFVLAKELSHSTIPPGTLLTIVVAAAATTLGSVYIVTRFWMWLLGGARGDSAPEAPRPAARASHTNELDPARRMSLPDKSYPSITEQTTRTLDHAEKNALRTEDRGRV
jgi:hypothetical protein